MSVQAARCHMRMDHRLNVIEIDAASNNGVDNIRQIKGGGSISSY